MSEKVHKEVFDLSKITSEMARKQFIDYATMKPAFNNEDINEKQFECKTDIVGGFKEAIKHMTQKEIEDMFHRTLKYKINKPK